MLQQLNSKPKPQTTNPSMEIDKKEELEIEMEILLHEIFNDNFNGSEDTAVSNTPSSSSSSTPLSSGGSFQRFSRSPDLDRDLSEWCQSLRAGNFEETEFETELCMPENYAFPLDYNPTESWVNANQFDISQLGPSVSDYASFSPYCKVSQFAQFSRENSDIPDSVSYHWRGKEVDSAKLPSFTSKRMNESLIGVEGHVYLLAKDTVGCRFLQRKLQQGKECVDLIFNGVISHVIELSVNPSGNYLVQKLIEVCDEEQRKHIVDFLTRDPSGLVSICVDSHGTRTLQKLVETIKTQEEIGSVVLALDAGFLDIAKDHYGNHVIQKCLDSFDVEDNKVIFDTAVACCMEISTHQHGCCVMKKCIEQSSGNHREKLVDAICTYGLDLAQDAFGNFVMQDLLELKHSLAFKKLAYQFQGRYAQLSMQKFSSNVVEKCLKVFAEPEKTKIVRELLSVPQFKLILQHQFANYVILTALQNCKGSLYAALVGAILPHSALQRNTHCKRIFKQVRLRKN